MTRTLVLFAISLIAAGCGTTTTTSPTPTQDTATLLGEFSSQLIPGGTASREFDVTTAGAMTVTLKSTTPAGVMVGVGVGIPRSDGSCALSAAVEAVAGAAAQLSMAAAAGPHCARVYDPGTLTAPLSFTISISRP